MYTKDFNVVFTSGGEYEFDFTLNELGGLFAAEDSKIIFTLTNDAGKNFLNGNVESVYLPQGTFINNEWTVGVVSSGDSLSPVFKLVVTSNTVTYVKITATAVTSSNDTVADNNIAEFYFEPINKNSLEYAKYEDVHEVPTSAFADTTDPKTSEVLTWANDNIDQYNLINGTHLTYNSNPYTESITWDNISIVLDVSGETTISEFKINYNSLDLTGVNNVTTSANFNDVGFKAAIDAELAAEGLIGAVNIIDNIDGGSTITINITSQSGIWHVLAQTGVKNYFPNTITKTSIQGRKTPDHIWVLNNNVGTVSINKNYQGKTPKNYLDSPNVFYVDPLVGSDENGEISDPERPFRSLEYVVSRLSTARTKIYYDLNMSDVVFYSSWNQVGFIDLSAIYLSIRCDVDMRSTSPVVDIKEHTKSAETKITITGKINKPTFSSAIDGVENCDNKELILRDLAVSQLTLSDILTASSGPIEVVCLNVKTNVPIGSADVNITEVGEAILRSANITI